MLFIPRQLLYSQLCNAAVMSIVSVENQVIHIVHSIYGIMPYAVPTVVAGKQ
ncbi:hypothetical protein SAMN05421747_101163 [Parapedobacter composti]|uniref:Uncharacterized protein n=1 Tax=Parapedobacter composti TaxID=623281 RepID=A0A1I1E3Q4_9SPHI|nr:hypothetical protein SAMN05421747_101163 [Parapedobacter composti]